MKAIVIAAGFGSRLLHLTKDLPKCLLDVQGKNILMHQLDAFNANGITDLCVVKGYKQEKLTLPGIRYYLNENYPRNNILNSLMCAEQEFNEPLIATYGDILFKPRVVEKLLESTADISIIVDLAWQQSYEGRTEHPITQAEKVKFDVSGDVLAIGKLLENTDDAPGEFIGMLKCSKRGAEIFKERFHHAKKEYAGQPFIRAKTFEQAYITDFIQYLTNNGIKTRCVFIEHGWREIDTAQDLNRARENWSKE